MTWDSVSKQRNYAFFIEKLGRRIAHCGLFLYELEVSDNVGRDPSVTHTRRRRCKMRLLRT